MEFITKIKTDSAKQKIGYDTPVMFVGSCFSGEIGRQFSYGKMDVLINPFGVLYNPLSTARALEVIMENRAFSKEDLYCYDNKYLSFYHDTSFSSRDNTKGLIKINRSISEARSFLSGASFLFVTFGTAWVYRWKENNEVVANCHKIPAARFSRHLLKTKDIVTSWQKLVSELKNFNKRLNIVFTVSPVRHLKDGAHGNQLSKSILTLAIDELTSANIELSYFPSYELMLDELRDYRFYKKDMVHPSDTAIEYIWERFRETYFTSDAVSIYDRVAKITEAMRHKITDDNTESIQKFRNSMLDKIKKISNDYPFVNLGEEENYFNNIISEE